MTDVLPLPTPERFREEGENIEDDEEHGDKPQSAKPKRKWQTREIGEAHLTERATIDAVFMETFNPHTDLDSVCASVRVICVAQFELFLGYH
jgi:hypothetical protein